MNSGARKSDRDTASISGVSVERFFSKDDSLASLLLDHGIIVRDFILLSFLADQKSMSVSRLSRITDVEPEKALQGLERLVAVKLVLHDPATSNDPLESIARITDRGEEIAGRIGEQLE
jgi:hypothetical protein